MYTSSSIIPLKKEVLVSICCNLNPIAEAITMIDVMEVYFYIGERFHHSLLPLFGRTLYP
jgi:hypothetical protein